jgi:hypothetical protein
MRKIASRHGGVDRHGLYGRQIETLCWQDHFHELFIKTIEIALRVIWEFQGVSVDLSAAAHYLQMPAN